MNMGGLGKGLTTPRDSDISQKDIITPATDVIQKAATAGKLKSIKLKVKFSDKKKQPNTDAS